MEMKHTGEHRLNIEHRNESQTLMKYFALMLPRKIAELQNQAQRLQNMNVKPLCSSIEVAFIVSWVLKTNLETNPNLVMIQE